MPRTLTITKEVYQFDELSDTAKNTARDWMRECMTQDNDLLDRNLDDFETIAKILGVDFKQVEGRTYGPNGRHVVYQPAIHWSGFCSQGDGLCFEGTWSMRKESIAEIKAHAPEDTELHRIAEALWPVMMGDEFYLSAHITHSGSYYHEGSVIIEVNDDSQADDDKPYPDTQAEQIRDALRDLMRWMYAQLEADNEYLNSDEQIDESIECNEYEFDEDGSII